MSTFRPKEETIWEILQNYKRKYKASYISLLIKQEFLDIFTVEQKSFVDGKSTSPLSEDQWYIFKDKLITSWKKNNFEKFLAYYFKRNSNIEYTHNVSELSCQVIWWFKAGAAGSSYFEKPGAILVQDVGEYWIIVFFSHDELKKQDYSAAIEGLKQLETQLKI
jgi:hypothetical protein